MTAKALGSCSFSRPTTPRAAVLLLVVAALYQVVMGLSEGLLYIHVYPLVLSIPIVIVGLWAILTPGASVRVSWHAIGVLGALLIVGQVGSLIWTKHFWYVPDGMRERWAPYLGMSVMMLGSALLLLRERPPRWGVWVIAGVSLVTAFCVISRSPDPKIDVWMFHQESAEALLDGRNPYAIDFINPYGQGNPFYSQEVQVNGRITFGFPYPPMSMWLYLPSYVLTGESRYAHALAYVLSGLGIALLSRSRISLAAGLLLMTAPAQWVVIENAWTEPFLLLMLVGLALVATRCPKWTPVMLGLFLATKQYTIIFVPLIFLILPRPLTWKDVIRFLLITGITGAVVSLPLALWNWSAFWNSCVSIQLKQPFRGDAFSYLALYYSTQPQGFDPPKWWSWIAFALLIPMWALLLWRMPRNITGFVLGVTGCMIVFLFFNRQSFLNYHTFAIGAMLTGVSLLSHGAEHAGRERPAKLTPRTE